MHTVLGRGDWARAASYVVIAASFGCSSGGGAPWTGPADAGATSPPASSAAETGAGAAGADDPARSGHPQCDEYLACVAASSPSTYAAQLTVYGVGSECWKNDTQAQNCETACAKAFSKIAYACVCDGGECGRALGLAAGEYEVEDAAPSTPGADGCQLATALQNGANEYEVTGDVDAKHPQMTLTWRMPNDSMTLEGTIKDGKGKLTATGLGDGVDVAVTIDRSDHFVLHLRVASSCNSDVVAMFRKK